MVSKCVGLLDVLGKLYKCKQQHLYSKLILVTHKKDLLINCSDSDSERPRGTIPITTLKGNIPITTQMRVTNLDKNLRLYYFTTYN